MRYLKIMTVLSLSVSLMGCAKMDAFFEEKIQEKAEIESKEEYKEYKDYVDNGIVDENGQYVANDNNVNRGKVHVTFSMNSSLDVKYYRDAQKTILVDVDNCYLNPGETLYADVSVDKSINTKLYKFSGFKVYTYDTDKRKTAEDTEVDYAQNGAVLTIPLDSDYAQLSVEPIGERVTRKIKLSVNCKNDDETSNIVTDGTWTVNSGVLGENVSEFEINSYTDYLVSYRFDPGEYFLLETTPSCYYRSNREGVVVFDTITPEDDITEVSVLLHKLVDISILSDVTRTVTIDDESQVVSANGELKLTGIRYGEKIAIQTGTEWKALENSRDLICLSVDKKLINTYTTSYVYTMMVPTPGDVFLFDPNEYHFEHGTVDFYAYGMKISSAIELPRGTTITYEEHSADEGYCIVAGEHKIVVGQDAETKKKISEIIFVDRVDVGVNLPQPTYGGTVTYQLNGTGITGDFVTAFSGDKISMEFHPWEGWMLRDGVKDGIEYVVKTNNGQTASVNGNDIVTSVFVEDDKHKPELTVVLDKSVGKDLSVSVNACGINEIKGTFEDGFFKSEHMLVDGTKIGTEEGINIALANSAIPSGKAYKLVVRRKTKNGNENPQVLYVTDITKEIAPIDIYWRGHPSTSLIWYENIDISISLVDVDVYSRPDILEHSTIRLVDQETMVAIKEGDIIDSNQKVKVIIIPADGYYIEGKNVEDGLYQETMSFKNYVDDIDEIIDKHPVNRRITLTLEKKDSYATYEYYLDGDIVSGTIGAREGQTIKLKYTITDEEWKLTEKVGGVMGWGSTDKTVTKEMKVTADMDNTSLSRETFGILTEKR